MQNNRVVVSGWGMVTPIGLDVESFWRNCINGKNGITPIERKDTELFEAHYGGQIKNFKSSNKTGKMTGHELGRGCQLLISGIEQLLGDSGIDKKSIDHVYIGTTMGETSIDYTTRDNYYSIESPFDLIRQIHINNLLADAMRELEIEAEGMILCNACSAGNYAIVTAYECIRNGDAEAVIVGGVDPFSSSAYYGFNRLNAIASTLCRPFDKNRDGMLVSEGAACLLIESEAHAVHRNAGIIAEIAGYGISSDAFHINVPHPEGKGIIEATTRALRSSGISPTDVDFVSAHGTGTIANDKVESMAINRIFKDYRVPVTSIKSMLGHTMGAASAIEAIMCCLAIRDGVIPPTINYAEKDSECDINVVANKPLYKEVNVAVNNSYAFGGSNASVVFKKH